MTIRSRLRWLARGGLLAIAVAAVLWWWSHRETILERQRTTDVEHLRTVAINLHALTLDLLHDDTDPPPTDQWRAIARRIEQRIHRPEFTAIPNIALLREVDARIGKRFERYLKAREACRRARASGAPRPGCDELLRRLGTQLQLAIQDLFVEIGRAEAILGEHLDHATSVSSLLLFSLLALLTLLTVLSVWPMSRRLNRGLTALMRAAEHFGRGDYDHRLPVDGGDEIAVLAATFNRMAEQRKLAEKRLHENREWLGKLLDTLPHGVQENDLDGVITYANLAYHRLLGLPPGELIGRRIWDFVPEEAQRGELRAGLRRVVDELPKPTPFVTENRTVDGRMITVEIIWDYQRDGNGDVVGFLSVVSDVTARARAEQALLASEANLSEAQHIARIGSWELDLGEDRLSWSRELYRIFELESGVAGDYATFLATVHPDDRARVDEAYRRSLRERSRYDIVHRLLLNDGRIKYIHERCKTEYDAEGTPLRSIGTAQDITQQVRVEQRLQYRLRLEGALAAVSSLLAGADDDVLDETLERALQGLGEAVGADRAYLFQLDAAGQCFDNTHEWCADGIASQQAELQAVPVTEFAAAFARFERGEEIVAPTPEALDEDLRPLREFMLATGIRSLLNMPVFGAGRLRGMIGFDVEREERSWPKEDIRLLRTVAESLGGVLGRHAAQRRIREHTHFLESLDRVSRLIAGRQPSTTMLNELCELLLNLFDADRAWLLCAASNDAPGYRVPIEATRPAWPGAVATGLTIPEDDYSCEMARRVFSSDQPQIVHSDEFDDLPAYLDDYHIRSQIFVAVPTYATHTWVLGLHQCSHRRDWSQVEQRLFKTIAERVGLALASGEMLERLRENERRLLEAERIARTGSWELRLDGRRMSWSAQECRCLGLAEDCAPSLEALLAAAHEDDRAALDAALRALIEGCETRLDLQHRIVTAAGEERIVHQLAIVDLDDDGKPSSLIGTTQDVTERVRLERELERHREHLESLVAERTALVRQQAQIIEQTNDAVLTTDLDGVIKSWNGGAERLFGLDAASAVGHDLRIVLHRGGESFSRERIIEPLRNQGRHELELEMSRRDDGHFPAHLSLSLLRDERGAPLGMIGYVVDLSVSKQRERELQALSERLEASNRELESFSYSVSHDLRAPLRAIDGFSLALLEDYGDRLDETARDYLDRVRGGAQRMGALIDDLLQLSRVNRVEPRCVPVDLAALGNEIVTELRAGEAEREVEVDIQGPMIVSGDPRLLRSMLTNLLGNAWKFTARQTHARIRFAPDAQRPGVFYIEDNGVGFDMRHADKLFGAFQRLHRASEFPGTGVGLATVQRIVHRHGGWIRARAEQGRGAVFRFSLQSDIPPDEDDHQGSNNA